jgi:hypothetical protein
MKRALLALGFALALVAGCDSYKDDIATVQAAETTPGQTNAELASDIAGANGTVAWSATDADGREETVRVVAEIDRPADSGPAHKIQLEFLHDRKSRDVVLDRVLVDGREQNLVSGVLNLLLMQLE